MSLVHNGNTINRPILLKRILTVLTCIWNLRSHTSYESLCFRGRAARVDVARPPELITQPGPTDAGGPQERTRYPAVQKNTCSNNLKNLTRTSERKTSQKQYLQSLNDVPVVPGSSHHRIPAGSIASRESPAHGCLLDNVVGFYKQVVHLVVQVHRDGYRSAFGWRVQTDRYTISVSW